MHRKNSIDVSYVDESQRLCERRPALEESPQPETRWVVLLHQRLVS